MHRLACLVIAFACAPHAARASELAPISARLEAVVARLACAQGSPLEAWHVQASDDAGIGAYAMAEGRLVVGAPFVRRMSLDDAGLAMLVAHEMAHVIAGHRRARVREDEGEDPAAGSQAIATAIAQEDEADRVGFSLALRAGWPASALLRFFDKLAETEPAGTFSRTHRGARERAGLLRAGAGAASDAAKKSPGGACAPPGQ